MEGTRRKNHGITVTLTEFMDVEIALTQNPNSVNVTEIHTSLP